MLGYNGRHIYNVVNEWRELYYYISFR